MKVKILDTSSPTALADLQAWADKDFTIDTAIVVGTKLVILYHE